MPKSVIAVSMGVSILLWLVAVRLSILPLDLISAHDMILAVNILATVFLATHIVLSRLRHRKLTRRVQRMLW